ncbi:MAG: ATP-binding protein, partial [Desulfovibrionaceae bacterium]
AGQRGLRLGFTPGAGLPARLLGDEGRLRQVLFNLVNNAVKFTEQGEVAVAADWEPEPPDRGRLVLTVRDTGPGIPEDRVEEMFEPFTQLDGGLTRRHSGTGLGLSIVRRLVEAMQGAVRLGPAPGGGLLARVSVPLALAPAPGADAGTGPDEAGTDCPAGSAPCDLDVLVVDDDPLSRKTLAAMLERLGQRPEGCPDGRSALERLARGGVDLVLLDVQMPGQDGMETVRRIRAGEAGRPDVAVAAVTAYAMAGDSERCLAAGMDGHLVKPVDIQALQNMLDFLYAEGRIRPPEEAS